MPCLKALILDVDGVVSPVHGRTVWGDDVIAGHVFGPVLVSPSLCRRLDHLGRAPGVYCWWLTSWTARMRAAMQPFPGHDWPVVADQAETSAGGRSWWKLAAIDAWLAEQGGLGSIAWCDDDLRGGRVAAARRRFAARGFDSLLVSPRTDCGLTPIQMERLESWAGK